MFRSAVILVVVALGVGGLGRAATAAPVGTKVWCDAFGGERACGSMIRTDLDGRGPDNGKVPGSILNEKWADAEGYYDGNDVGAKGLSDKEMATLFGPDAVLLGSTDKEVGYGSLSVDKLWSASGYNNAEAGTFTFKSAGDGGFVPRWLTVKGADGFTVWDISSVITATGKVGAMVYSGVYSTEGTLAGGKNFASLSHASIWGTMAAVPLPNAAWMLLTGIVGLVGLQRTGRGRDRDRTVAGPDRH